LYLIGLIKWPHNNKTRGRGRPYVYSPTVILKCFIVRIWFRLDSNRALHEYLAKDIPYNKKVMKVCGLSRIPSRRTFDRRLASISNDIKNRITIMGELFVHDKIIDTCVLSTDSTLIKAKGYVWHKSSMTEGVVPRSGIDTDAMWGFSHTKGWIFGYKLHMVASTGSIIVPLAADFTTANIPDNQMYSVLAASLPIAIIKKMLYMSADPGYDDHELYDLSTDMGFRLVCPVQRYKNTPEERIKLIEFYESNVGQIIYSLRSTSIEPLIGHIKSAFRIDPLPVRGYDTTCAIVLLSVLLYQILVYYNCKTNKDNPMAIKYLLGT
jgi:Transposase DDE domain